MITDKDIVFADNEAPPGNGAAATNLAGNSITGSANVPFTYDMSAPANPLGSGVDSLGSSEMELMVTIDTNFAIGSDIRVDWRLVTLPCNPSIFDNPAAGNGKSVQRAVTVTGGTIANIPSHGIPLGTPVTLITVTGVTGVVSGGTYYVIPTSDDSIALADSLQDAIAGTANGLAGTGGFGIVFLFDTVAQTGPIHGGFLQAGNQFCGRTKPRTQVGPGPLVDTTLGYGTPEGRMLTAGASFNGAVGAGANALPSPGRFLALMTWIIGGNAGTAGRYTVSLGANGGSNFTHNPSGFQV